MSLTAVNAPPAAPEQRNAHAAAELPVHLTGFIGRTRELDELTRLLEPVRLLTLTGAGGSGKTRLAREVATRAAGGFTRIAWADLAPVTEAALVAPAVAASLHVPEHAAFATMDRVVSDILGDRVLLVLDNCEHLVDACAELTETLLLGCPQLTVLATSREALGIASETAWLVPRLDDPESAQLFVERAQATVPSFTMTEQNAGAIREICRRLDGIPLAIELAAARVRVLTPEQIAARLDDAFKLLTAGSRTALARHRTLRGTMDWSFALLLPREQALLRRLAIFSGGFSLEGAEYVCADKRDADHPVTDWTLEPDDVLDGVAALVDKSLVVMEAGEREARYHLLETVRQYGLERLIAAGEHASARERHASYHLALAEAIAPKLVGGEHEAGLVARMSLEHENLRLASAWAAEHPSRADAALRFADALFWYWYGTGNWLRSGQFNESRQYLEHALRVGVDADPVLRGRAWSAEGLTALAQGDYEISRDAFEKALGLLSSAGDPYRLGLVYSKLGAAHLMLGDMQTAMTYIAQAEQVLGVLPPSMMNAFVFFWGQWAAMMRGDLADARVLHHRGVQLGRLLNHRTILAHQSMLLARLELMEGNREEAAAALREALHTHLAIGDGWGLTLDLEGTTILLTDRGNYELAARLMGAADALRQRISVAMVGTDHPGRAVRAEQARAVLGHEEFDRRYAEGRALSIEDVFAAASEATVTQTAEFRIPVPSANAAAAAAAPQPAAPVSRARLRVRALGPLQVFVDDAPIDPSAWGSARPRELLVYLLMHPEGRTKEHVGLAFWPESSAAQLRNNFHVTVHRLRKALGGSEWIVLSNDRYSIDPALVAEFDATTFDRDIVAARRALKKHEDGATAGLERALELFRGDFLDGEPAGDWHLDHRDRFQRQYIDGLMELGTEHDAKGRSSRAAEAYRRVLARDELHEQAVTALMRAHARVGERAQALRIYQRFADRLRKELESEPDEETQELVEQLQSGKDV